MEKHFVINLGRQLGSGGKEIGERLAKELNIAFYDKELIQLASKSITRTILLKMNADTFRRKSCRSISQRKFV